MLNKLLPRKVWYSLQQRKETAELHSLPSATLDASKLRADIPDITTHGSEWPDVEQIMSTVGLQDPAGGVNRGDRRAIYQLARAMSARAVLEVGTHVGASTLMLALAVKRNGGTLRTVDIADVNAPDAYWRKTGCRQNPRQTLALAGVEASFHRSDSVEWLRNDMNTYDLVFLDGLHEAQTLYRELPLALRRLNPNGLVLLHDVFPDLYPLWPDGNVIPGPWLAIARYAEEDAPITVTPLGALPWPTKQGSNVTSLAVVTRRSSGQ